MPNHVTNEIFIQGPKDRVEAFLAQSKVTTVHPPDIFDREEKTVEREFSFRGFAPPPEHPDYTSGSCAHHHPSPGMVEYIKQMLGENVDPNHPLLVGAVKPEEHPNCWLVWNRENWGTKWDAYDVCVKTKPLKGQTAEDDGELVECRVVFDTAWSPPIPVFNKILETFADIIRGFRWMDEDMWGGGGGYFKLFNGRVVEQKDGINDPDGPDGALWWWLASQLKDYSQEKHQERLDEIAEDERLAAEEMAAQEG